MYWLAGILIFTYGILFLLSRKHKTGKAPPGVPGLFYPMALFLYQRARLWKIPFVNSRQVEKDLRNLHPGMEGEQLCRDYYVKKIALSLMLCFVGTLLGTAVTYSARIDGMLKNGAVTRGNYSEQARELTVSAVLSTGEEKQFQITVNPRQLSGKELQGLYSEFAEQLPNLILGKNTSLEQIRYDLNLEDYFPEYPFVVEWQSDRTDVLHRTGKIECVEEPVSFILTAKVSYNEQSWIKEIPVTVVPFILSEEEILERDIAKLLMISENDSLADAEWILPQVYRGESLIWKELFQDNGPLLAMGAIMVAVLLFIMADKDLHDELSARREAIKCKYPDVVQKLVLYLGAGMTVRAAFQKMSGEYEQENAGHKKDKYTRSQAIYQEISYMCRELQSGVSEMVAYENFGRRVGVQEYLRLSTLLTQNLKRGNSTLLQRLREEAERASAERLQSSRKLGEEASTKLLVPMVLLLLVVMLMIMIPAFSAMGT